MKSFALLSTLLFLNISWSQDRLVFFQQKDLAEKFEAKLKLSEVRQDQIKAGDKVYADTNGDKNFEKLIVDDSLPNGELLVHRNGGSSIFKIYSQAVIPEGSPLAGKKIFGDHNLDQRFGEYVVVAQSGRKVLGELQGVSDFYFALDLDQIALKTKKLELLADRNQDRRFGEYAVVGVFGNGDLLLSANDENHRTSVLDIAFTHLEHVGTSFYADNNRDGYYASYTVGGVTPEGKVVARENRKTDYLSFSPEEAKLSASQTAFDPYPWLAQKIKIK